MTSQEIYPWSPSEAVPAVTIQEAPRPSHTLILLPEYNVNISSNPVFRNESEDEQSDFVISEFSDKSLRRSFIKKVYAIVLAQLAVTAGFMLLFRFTPALVQGVRDNIWVICGVVIAFYIGVYIAILWCEEQMRKVPYNFIFLGMFTLAISFLVAVATSFDEGSDVLIAFGVTVALVAGLTLFTFQTRIDFTMMTGSLFSIFLCVLLFGIIAACTGNYTVNLVYSGLVVILFSLYLVCDTQLMIEGLHKYSISPEEYIFAALCLYMDVMNILLWVLSRIVLVIVIIIIIIIIIIVTKWYIITK